MTVKEKITELFENRKGEFISGEELAEISGCTRGAVWKAVRSLQAEGYSIEAVTNRGYCMKNENDVISVTGIRKYMKSQRITDLKVFKTIDSTNIALKKSASEGASEGTLIVSGEQTAGRGRLGRSFFSPSDSGIYMSLLLKPDMGAAEAIKITTAAASATAEAIEELTGRKTEIKWVNDIYADGRKVCGILTEAAFNIEFGGFDYAVLGIGINVYEPAGGFPEDIRNTAGALLTERQPDMRNRIIAGVIDRFMEYYEHIDISTYFESYDRRLMWKGQEINIISPSGSVPAVLKGIDNECRLLVSYDDGSDAVVSSGEISIRKK